ncbi:MAG: winged helix-turn-helix transcriptional regulator [Armatimonadetes bacterium]|nr:winged helix-turn-helix transcriptional regulator [Armatimonadota bacterium]
MAKARRTPARHRENKVFLTLLAKFYRGLGDPTRLRILECLKEDERTVSELVDLLRSPQGRVSSHLAYLRWCGFVMARQAGHYVSYRLADPRVQQILALGKELVTANAAHIFAGTRPR